MNARQRHLNDGESGDAAASEKMSVLVDWTGQWSNPDQFIFDLRDLRHGAH
jgi:hypothetical protein